MIKAVIFDFGGPIMTWDGEDIFSRHEDHRSLERDTLKNIMNEYFSRGHQGDYENLFEFCREHHIPSGVTIEELNEILHEAEGSMRIRTEMIELIKELKKSYKVGLLSNFTSNLISFLKQIFNIYDLFDSVIGSYDVKMKKPDPCIYHHTLKQLGVHASEAVFIDDLEENVQAAEAVGMKGIVFENSAQCKNDLQKILAS